MDIGFLEKNYQLKYPDTFMVHAIEADETCRGLYRNIMQLEGNVEDVMRSMGKDYLALHEKLLICLNKSISFRWIQ